MSLAVGRAWLLFAASVGVAATLQRPAPAPAAVQPPAAATASRARQMAITIDDLPVASVLPADSGKQRQITYALLQALQAHKVPAIGFVNEGKLAANGLSEAQGTALLAAWTAAGMALGNHTYAHADLHQTPLAQFEAQVVAGERVTRPLLERGGKKLQFFRHPFLHTGRSLETRRALDAFLTARGYRVAPVTIDNYDYLFAAALDRAVARGDSALQARVLSAYLLYMEQVVGYYERQSVALFGREIRQVLLIHASALNARRLDVLASMLERRGYTFVPLDQAIADPAYRSADTFVGEGGISWIHRWALSAGRVAPFFDGEPKVPEWVTTASK